MKKYLVVGADNLGATPKILRQNFGYEVIHWNGRRARPPSSLPKDVKLVLVYTGFVNHSLMRRVRELARKQGVKIFFASRGLSELFASRAVH